MINLVCIKAACADIWRQAGSFTTFYIMIAITILAVIAGPFGTAALDPGVRTGFWIAIVCASTAFGFAACAVSLCLVGDKRPVMFDSLAILLLCFVLSPLFWLFTNKFMTAFGLHMMSLTHMMLYVFLIAAIVFISRRLMPAGEAPERSASGQFATDDSMAEQDVTPPNSMQDQVAMPRLLRRLPPEHKAEVLRLTGQGHHVEIVTETGIHTLRMRLKDAIDEMETVKGLSVHRSHWVTHEAITGWEQETPQKVVLILKNGDRIPVSRKFLPLVEQAGFLD